MLFLFLELAFLIPDIFFGFQRQYLGITAAVHIDCSAFGTAQVKALVDLFDLIDSVAFRCVHRFRNGAVDPALNRCLHIDVLFGRKCHGSHEVIRQVHRIGIRMSIQIFLDDIRLHFDEFAETPAAVIRE